MQHGTAVPDLSNKEQWGNYPIEATDRQSSGMVRNSINSCYSNPLSDDLGRNGLGTGFRVDPILN
jgi:hypothetical protein